MNRYLQTVAIVIFVIGTTPFVRAQTANQSEPTTIATADLTPEQKRVIYAAVTDGIRERDPPAIKVGDKLPWWAEVRILPDSLQLKSVRGMHYTVLLIHSAMGTHNEVFLVDPATNRVVTIIRKPLTFQF